MENRINRLFKTKKENILSVYFTAGFPKLNDTVLILEELEKSGADLAEIGIPFSDPTADGPVIQESSHQALENGMSLELLFNQLESIRKKVSMPLILMGYFNPVYQFGVENFCRKCREKGIDGVIIPDMPLAEYNENYRPFFEGAGIHNILMITPQTSDERIREIDRNSSGFIYMVSSSSTTGKLQKADDFHQEYFDRVNRLGLKNPRMIGFGISNRDTFRKACANASGAIIGTAFIKALQKGKPLAETVRGFVNEITK
jgi:tryptophan synthase alpha chain